MLPSSAGISFKPQHFHAVMESDVAGLWLEVHPENYLAPGGARVRMLDSLAARFPLSLHGVSLSLGGLDRPDPVHLAMLGALVARVRPRLVSEHLAWSRLGQRYEPDLLPVRRSQSSLLRIAAHIMEAQDALGCRIAIENPSHYIALEGHEWSEPEFLTELTRRTGCLLLVDVSNLLVSAHNVGGSAWNWLNQIPLAAVAEIHLGGYSDDPILGGSLRIDSHDGAIAEDTWSLYRELLTLAGPRPSLIEWDQQLPSFSRLLDERERAQQLLGEETAS
jgi:uncharacterized protein (UPF0276 family)